MRNLHQKRSTSSWESSFSEIFHREFSPQEKEMTLREWNQACKNLCWNDHSPLSLMHAVLKEFYEQHFSIHQKIQKIHNLGLFYEILNLFEETVEKMEFGNIEKDDFHHLLKSIPASQENFLDWYTDLIKAHAAYPHHFYSDFLRNTASHNDIRYYLAQESTLDPRFDDILALIQIGAPIKAKLEIASNYWDEMGNGEVTHVHSLSFQKVLAFFNVSDEYINQNLSLDAIISGNLSSYLALHRKNYYKAIGYFAVAEYLVPLRFRHFVKGCQRIGIPSDKVHYHKLHIPIDSRHAAGWIKNVLSEAAQDPLAAREILLGTFYRLNSSKRYLDSLEQALAMV